jgi:hypothetical protein
MGSSLPCQPAIAVSRGFEYLLNTLYLDIQYALMKSLLLALCCLSVSLTSVTFFPSQHFSGCQTSSCDTVITTGTFTWNGAGTSQTYSYTLPFVPTGAVVMSASNTAAVGFYYTPGVYGTTGIVTIYYAVNPGSTGTSISTTYQILFTKP